jgi:hypothetical protein
MKILKIALGALLVVAFLTGMLLLRACANRERA